MPRKLSSLCRVQFCFSPSILENDSFTRYCKKHLPENIERFKEARRITQEASVLFATAARKRKAEETRVRIAQISPVEGSTQATGPMGLSNARKCSGWGAVRPTQPGDKHKHIHFFRERDNYSICGRYFAHNKPVGAHYGKQCLRCFSRLLHGESQRGAVSGLDIEKFRDIQFRAQQAVHDLVQKKKAAKILERESKKAATIAALKERRLAREAAGEERRRAFRTEREATMKLRTPDPDIVYEPRHRFEDELR
jgi:hypothetical protein